MAIGPQIPSHIVRPAVDVEDDEYGPSPPQQAHGEPRRTTPPSPPRLAGPQFPVQAVRPPSQTNDDDEDEDEDAYVPSLPPDLVMGPAQPTKPKESRRTLGPARPGPAPQLSDDSDEEVGPMPAPAGSSADRAGDAVQEFIAREERRAAAVEAERAPKKLVREEWMLVPPTSSSVLGSLDPTKLKARQFSRSARPDVRAQDNSLWTETPAERQARIKDEVDGKRRRATDVADADADDRENDRKRRRHDDAIAAQVEQYNQETRGKSLVDLHKSSKEASKESEESVIWDHARDMSVGGRLMDEGQRSKMISDARGLGDRFGKGKSGGWL